MPSVSLGHNENRVCAGSFAKRDRKLANPTIKPVSGLHTMTHKNITSHCLLMRRIAFSDQHQNTSSIYSVSSRSSLVVLSCVILNLNLESASFVPTAMQRCFEPGVLDPNNLMFLLQII
jgi:hypothetical protein